MKQLTFDQAWIFFMAGEWKKWDIETIVHFQLCQKYLCVGADKFFKGCKKYGVIWKPNIATTIEGLRQKKKFYKQTKRSDQQLEDFGVSKRTLALLEKDVMQASMIINQKKQRTNEKNKV